MRRRRRRQQHDCARATSTATQLRTCTRVFSGAGGCRPSDSRPPGPAPVAVCCRCCRCCRRRHPHPTKTTKRGRPPNVLKKPSRWTTTEGPRARATRHHPRHQQQVLLLIFFCPILCGGDKTLPAPHQPPKNTMHLFSCVEPPRVVPPPTKKTLNTLSRPPWSRLAIEKRLCVRHSRTHTLLSLALAAALSHTRSLETHTHTLSAAGPGGDDPVSPMSHRRPCAPFNAGGRPAALRGGARVEKRRRTSLSHTRARQQARAHACPSSS